MVVKLGDQLLAESESRPGYYEYGTKGWMPPRKNALLITINPPSGTDIPALVGRKYTIKGTVGKMAHITSPLSYGRINTANAKTIFVTWNPKVVNGICRIFSYQGPKVEKEVFAKENISDISLTIPIKHFKPKTKYGIFLSYRMRDLSFKKKKKVNPQSKFTLNYSVGRFFNTK